jgi:ribonuclease HI
MKLTAFIDGSCFGNPGESGFGVVLQDEEGRIIQRLGRYIGQGTNNIAEYRGLLGAVELAAGRGVEHLQVYSDSELLVRQMCGEYKIKQPHLRELHRQITDALGASNIRLEIQHVPRAQNKLADGLARQAIQARSDVTR